jgi:hypothetical protein
MVNQNDLRELERNIISQFTSQLATLGQQFMLKLENDVGDLKKLIEAKLTGLDQRVGALEDSISSTNAKITEKNGIVDRIRGLESLASLSAVDATSTSEALIALETKTKALETSKGLENGPVDDPVTLMHQELQ